MCCTSRLSFKPPCETPANNCKYYSPTVDKYLYALERVKRVDSFHPIEKYSYFVVRCTSILTVKTVPENWCANTTLSFIEKKKFIKLIRVWVRTKKRSVKLVLLRSVPSFVPSMQKYGQLTLKTKPIRPVNERRATTSHFNPPNRHFVLLGQTCSSSLSGRLIHCGVGKDDDDTKTNSRHSDKTNKRHSDKTKRKERIDRKKQSSKKYHDSSI